MKLTIDNLSGAGPVDYTGSITSAKSVEITRTLNAPSSCAFSLLPDAQGLPLPLRYARIVVTDDYQLVLFTGYVASPPALLLAGTSFDGPSYEADVTAISDELLLDNLLSVKSGTAINQPAAQTLATLTALTGSTSLAISASTSTALVGRYQTKAGSAWSANAGVLAASARSAYRVLAGTANIAPIGSVTHTLSEANGTLQITKLKAATVKLLANDVTVCGRVEPSAYVTETFQGDGSTVAFALTQVPFQASASERTTLSDLFAGATLNGQLWQTVDAGSRLAITAAGITCAGGTGRDGETVLSAIQQIELGGTVVIEAGGVSIGTGSAGLIAGLYTGSVSAANCFASFQVSQTGSSTQVTALINGSASGSTMLLTTGHLYTFRLRVYSPEMERVRQSYYYLGAGGIGSYGGDLVNAPGRMVLEVQDVTSGLPGAPTVLYDGTTTALPAVCTMGVLDSGSLTCSIKTFSCTQTDPIWVSMTPAGGNATTQYLGTTAEGASCQINTTGTLTFYPANVPPNGAVITVLYRTRHRAVARMSNEQSPATGSSTAAPATTMWVGTVSEPTPWSTADCTNAAAALLMSSSSATAAWAGTYSAWNLEKSGDVWPGDVLAIASVSSGIDATVVVRAVKISMGCAVPQRVEYSIQFANDWAEELALRLSATVPLDALLPQSPNQNTTFLVNLATLAVMAVSSSQIQISAGVSAPGGGGFEVKRKDYSFGPGVDSDLVLRSPVPNFIIPRLAAIEQYYVRMYDGATPPNYSQFSAAIFVNIPL